MNPNDQNDVQSSTGFVQIALSEFNDFFLPKGFTMSSKGNEITFERPHDNDKRVKVVVYTSISVGSLMTRACGKDSIKICTIFETEKKTYGLGKFPHVHRTGCAANVFARVYFQMKVAYSRGTQWISESQAKENLRKEAKMSGGYKKIEAEPCPLDKI